MAEPTPNAKASTKSYIKLIAVLVITLLVVIVIFQNTDAVQTRLLFVTINMPRALMLIITLLIGFVAGIITSSVMLSRRASR